MELGFPSGHGRVWAGGRFIEWGRPSPGCPVHPAWGLVPRTQPRPVPRGHCGLSEPWAAESRLCEVRVFASWRGHDSEPQTDLNQQGCEVPVSAGLAPEVEVTAPGPSQLPGICRCLCHFSACGCLTCPISASIFMGPPAGRPASFSSRGHLSLDLGPLIYPG